jgi:hypothetical protein
MKVHELSEDHYGLKNTDLVRSFTPYDRNTTVVHTGETFGVLVDHEMRMSVRPSPLHQLITSCGNAQQICEQMITINRLTIRECSPGYLFVSSSTEHHPNSTPTKPKTNQTRTVKPIKHQGNPSPLELGLSNQS